MRQSVGMKQVDQMFRAFADHNRLRILNLLNRQEMCVGDLVTILNIPQARTSRHLAYLRKAGLITSRKDGMWCYYSLTPAQLPFHRKLLECLTTCLMDVPEMMADIHRAEQLRHTGSGCCPEKLLLVPLSPEASTDNTNRPCCC
ncbi:MAG: ArsR/SmtB family transcription factor [Gemmataceae bacterium]